MGGPADAWSRSQRSLAHGPPTMYWGVPLLDSPRAQSAMKVCVCLRIMDTFQALVSTGSLRRMWSKKSCGVTADMSHLSLDSTSSSQLWNSRGVDH